MDGRELVAAIDALVKFVRSKWEKRASLDPRERDEIIALDTRVYALMGDFGLTFPPSQRNSIHDHLGTTQIPMLLYGAIPHPYASPDWLQMMAALRARAERIGAAGNGKGKRAPRGRKKADYKTIQREDKLAAAWVRARQTGEFKTEFARSKKYTLKNFDKLLDRVAKRRKAASE
jgi:hypothetical protein